MVSLRRAPSGFTRQPRRFASAGVVALSALLAVMLGVAPAAAQPPPETPDTPAEAATHLEQVQRDAEALTEEWHAARDGLDARQAEAEAMRQAVEPARAAAEAARLDEENFRAQIDELAFSTFESGSLDQFNALLASASPQEFLEQMSALELLTADYRLALGELTAAVERTEVAEADANAAVERAEAAADQAARAEQELGSRKDEADRAIDEAFALLESLTPEERAENVGPAVAPPVGPVTGTGVGVQALRVAQTFLGTPYQYGGNGPETFDCSGLVVWSFREVGVTMPRSSRQQATVGTPVPFDQLQPGDLVFNYQPISHVGIYAGDGKMVAAPQTGDVVKYQTVRPGNFTAARRV